MTPNVLGYPLTVRLILAALTVAALSYVVLVLCLVAGGAGQ